MLCTSTQIPYDKWKHDARLSDRTSKRKIENDKVKKKESHKHPLRYILALIRWIAKERVLCTPRNPSHQLKNKKNAKRPRKNAVDFNISANTFSTEPHFFSAVFFCHIKNGWAGYCSTLTTFSIIFKMSIVRTENREILIMCQVFVKGVFCSLHFLFPSILCLVREKFHETEKYLTENGCDHFRWQIRQPFFWPVNKIIIRRFSVYQKVKECYIKRIRRRVYDAWGKNFQ